MKRSVLVRVYLWVLTSTLNRLSSWPSRFGPESHSTKIPEEKTNTCSASKIEETRCWWREGSDERDRPRERWRKTGRVKDVKRKEEDGKKSVLKGGKTLEYKQDQMWREEEKKRSKVCFRRSSRRLTAMVTTVLSANAVITTFCKMFSCRETDLSYIPVVWESLLV